MQVQVLFPAVQETPEKPGFFRGLRLPKYRQQLPQKIGFVEFQGKRYYFTGKHNSNESLEQYQKFLRVNCLGEAAPEAVKAGTLSVAEMAVSYLDFAKTYYPAASNRSTRTSDYSLRRAPRASFCRDRSEPAK